MSGRGRLRGAAAAGLAVLALLIWGLPFPAYETATLLPVETVQLARTEDGRVLLRTEAGDGVGADWSAAVRELRANAPGTVLLDTAEQLVLCTDEPELLQEAAESGDLRPAVQLFWLRGSAGPELEDFAAAQESGGTVGRGGTLPVIREEDGRYRLA